jgi:hypothetical protein
MHRAEEIGLTDEVLFDEDELAGGIGSSGQSKISTDDNASASTYGEEETGGQREAQTGHWTSRSRA